MNRKLRRAREKADRKKERAPGMKPAHIKQIYQQAIGYHQQGRLVEAEDAYRKVLKTSPKDHAALFNLSSIVHQQGRFDEAVELSGKAVTQQPDHAGSHINLGSAYHRLGQLKEARAALEKAQDLAPLDALSHNNLASVLVDQGDAQSAIPMFQKAIELKPDFAGAYYNMGNAYAHLSNIEESTVCFEKALALIPDFPEGHYNLAKAYQETGRIDDALTHYRRAIFLRPDFEDAWNNLKITTKTALFLNGQRGRGTDDLFKDLPPSLEGSPALALYLYFLDAYRPHEADASHDAALAALPPESALINNGIASDKGPRPIFKQTIALLHFGRSGTGLMHSLIDNHPEISTLPGIFLCGYFNPGVWEALMKGDPARLPERFAERFAVLFDATSATPVPGAQGDTAPHLGVSEGMTRLGENKDEILRIDRTKFCNEARDLMQQLPRVDAASFLHVVHAAYEKTRRSTSETHSIFYHIHNPNEPARLTLLRDLEDVRLLMMVREPVQSCESWARDPYREHDITMLYQRIATMLFDIDRVMFRRQDSIGVRLEDLKARPKQTLQALCRWMGVADSPTLYEMTAQGKKWWGDPSSPDYDDNQEMSPFNDTCLRRPGGTVFSERDRAFLGTLYYPFRVLFGYCPANPEGFKRNLKVARQTLSDLFDFEKDLIEKINMTAEPFMHSGDFLMFRAALTDRLDVLEEFGTYPHMLTPLEISRED